MAQSRIGFLLAAGIVFTVTSIVSAGPVAGIIRTERQAVRTWAFLTATPRLPGRKLRTYSSRCISTSQPNTWTKTFRWEIPANTGLAPGVTLSIMELIPLIFPADSAGTDPLVKQPIADWHESIVDGDAEPVRSVGHAEP